jgi:hypothetical protein
MLFACLGIDPIRTKPLPIALLMLRAEAKEEAEAMAQRFLSPFAVQPQRCLPQTESLLLLVLFFRMHNLSSPSSQEG